MLGRQGSPPGLLHSARGSFAGARQSKQVKVVDLDLQTVSTIRGGRSEINDQNEKNKKGNET